MHAHLDRSAVGTSPSLLATSTIQTPHAEAQDQVLGAAGLPCALSTMMAVAAPAPQAVWAAAQHSYRRFHGAALSVLNWETLPFRACLEYTAARYA